MSMHAEPVFEVPELTAKAAQGAFPKGNKYLKMRDELGTIYRDEQFADLYPRRGQPAAAPWRLALVTVVQFWEDMTDREVAEAVRGRIDLKYLLSMELEDAGFDFSVLSEFRSRLLAGGAEDRLLEAILTHFQEREWLKAGGKQRTDATHILSAVRDLNQLEIVGETLHHTLNILAQIDPEWLRAQVTPEWFGRYGQRFTDFRLPKTRVKRLALAETIGQDGRHLLSQLYADTAPPYLREIPAVNVMRQVWLQQYYVENDTITRREAKNTPPAGRLIISPYDVESRCGQKRGLKWRGYKVHLTERCEKDTPHLITNVVTTEATVHDVRVVEMIHSDLQEKELLPDDHLLDSAYISADNLVDSEKEHEVNLVGPAPQDKSWQALAGDGFDKSRFVVNWEARSVTCPNGQQSRYWKPGKGRQERPLIRIVFHKQDCLSCRDRRRCTRSRAGPRRLTFPLKDQYDALRTAREREQTAAFREQYALRAGVAGTISQAVFALGMRRTRYRGLAKTHLQHLATAAAINLQRALDWLAERPSSKTRVSHFARLALTS